MASVFDSAQPNLDLLAGGHQSLNDGIPKMPLVDQGFTRTFNSMSFDHKGEPLNSPKYSHQNQVSLDGFGNPERLYQVIPRYAPNSNTDVKAGGLRGTPAFLRLVTDDATRSKNRPNVDSDLKSTVDSILNQMLSDGGSAVYTNFLLTDVQVQMNEKVQVSEVFGDTEVVYYFGKQPVIFNISGLLIDDKSNNWFTNFLTMYSEIGRGSELARNGELIEINLPNMAIMGSISGLSYSQNAQRDTDIPFSIQVICKRMKPIAAPPLTNALANENLAMALSAGPADWRDMSQINSIKNYIAKLSNGATTTGGIMGALSGLAALPGQISNFFGGITKQIGNFMGGMGILGNGSMFGFRGSLFSPVYGFLSSITKIIQSVFGGIASVFGAITGAVQTVLRDIRNISSMATGIVHAIENGISTLVNMKKAVLNDFRQTIVSLKNTVGCISRAPKTIADILRELASASLRNAAFLNKGPAAAGKKIALLNSGNTYTAAKGAKI